MRSSRVRLDFYCTHFYRFPVVRVLTFIVKTYMVQQCLGLKRLMLKPFTRGCPAAFTDQKIGRQKQFIGYLQIKAKYIARNKKRQTFPGLPRHLQSAGDFCLLDYYKAWPPEIFMTWPVSIFACSLDRNRMVSAMSSG